MKKIKPVKAWAIFDPVTAEFWRAYSTRSIASSWKLGRVVPVLITPITPKRRKSPGPALIKSLRGLRDTLASGQKLSDRYKVTTLQKPATRKRRTKR